MLERGLAARGRFVATVATLTAAAVLSVGLGISAAKRHQHCGGHPGHGRSHGCRTGEATTFGEQAARLAESYVGQRRSSQARDEWNPGGWWSGKCLKFVHVVYALLGQDTASQLSANSEYRRRLDLGQVRTSRPPPRGAEVFWPGGKWGHIAISAGGGRVVMTEGSFGDHERIDERAAKSLPGYAGWALPY
jgi:hypothetical protein